MFFIRMSLTRRKKSLLLRVQAHPNSPTWKAWCCFTAAVGAPSDIVEKQMYYVQSDGDNSPVLRPEGNGAGDESLHRTRPAHASTAGYALVQGFFFRHENPQKGRFREFFQFGLEIIGEGKPIGEVMIIQIFTPGSSKNWGLGPIIVHINSVGDKECRGEYRKKLIAYYRKHLPNLCKDCKRRFKENPFEAFGLQRNKMRGNKKKRPQSIDSLCAPANSILKKLLNFWRQTT